MGFHCGWVGKESACNAEELGLIPGLGRSSGEGKSYPLQYSGLENFMDCIVHGVIKSQTWLSGFHFHFSLLFSLDALYIEDFLSFVQYSFIDLKSIFLVGDIDKVFFSLYSAPDMDESSLGFHDKSISRFMLLVWNFLFSLFYMIILLYPVIKWY